MPWKPYVFTGPSDRRPRCLESERDYDAAGLLDAYAAAHAELRGQAPADAPSGHPFPDDVTRRLVEAHGFRHPVPSAPFRGLALD